LRWLSLLVVTVDYPHPKLPAEIRAILVRRETM
jgi:hypothetical protein